MSEEVKTTPHAPKVSVIVPVYKAEKYLRKCVDSILTQTFRDFEVILVDDGSPDRSGAICDTLSAEDAVKAAARFASEGDVVLLSPCCASFDLFRNYEDRGTQFKQAVRRL